MSNELQNWNTRMGNPFGEFPSDSELADTVGWVLTNNRISFEFDQDGDETKIVIGDVGFKLRDFDELV